MTGSTTVEVTITATLTDGFEWGTIATPWERVDDTTATLTVTLAPASCAEAAPVEPTITQAVCASGAVSVPTLELATTDEITYSVNSGPRGRMPRATR